MGKILDENNFRSKSVIEMLTVANEYCLFLEKSSSYSKKDILDFLQKISPLMYIKGALLPPILVSNPEANERYVTEEQWGNIYNELKAKFGKDDEYWIIDNDDETAQDPKKASLADSFSDVYQDMKDFVLLYQRNTMAAQENAAREIKVLFSDHWGIRLVQAHSWIHQLLFHSGNITAD